MLISCPFGLDPTIAAALRTLPPRILVYGLLNTNQSGDLLVLNRDGGATRDFVVPEWIKQLNGTTYDASTGQGNQIHVKSLVIDPWSAQPSVLIGSANFSDESVNSNDENAVLIAQNRWAAALVATEFLRVFEHYRFRNHLRTLAQTYDIPRPARRGAMLGAAEATDANDTIWLIAPDDVLVQEVEREVGRAVLQVSATNLWLAETNAWLAEYTQPNSRQQWERQIFARG